MSSKALFLLSVALGSAELGAQPANPSKLFEKVPPEVESALRERVSGFYQAHVDGKFRQADAFVCNDTKEYYYVANKPRYLSFAVQDIQWQDKFAKAKLTMLVEQHLMLPGFAGKPVKVPVPGTWKTEEGNWCWYVEHQDQRETPFGVMKSGTTPGAPPPMGGPNLDVATVQQGVKIDRDSLHVTRDLKPSTATVMNAMPGAASLSLDAPKLPGVEIMLDKTELGAGDKATLRIRANEKAAVRSFEVRILVGPLNKVLPLQVSIN